MDNNVPCNEFRQCRFENLCIMPIKCHQFIYLIMYSSRKDFHIAITTNVFIELWRYGCYVRFSTVVTSNIYISFTPFDSSFRLPLLSIV